MNLIKPMTLAAMSAILLAATATDASAQRVRVKGKVGPIKADLDLTRDQIRAKGKFRGTKVGIDASRDHLRVNGKRGRIKGHFDGSRDGVRVDGRYGPIRAGVDARRGRRHHGSCCQAIVTRDRYVLQPQRTYRPGRYVNQTRRVHVPGRWHVTYQNVTVPGYYRTVAKRVVTPGHWVVERRSRRTRASIDLGRHVRIDVRGKRRKHRRWVPACTQIVHEKVWVPARCERRAVRTWIKPCTRVETVKVYQQPRWVTTNVRVRVPGKTVWSCSAPRQHRRGIRRSRHRGDVTVRFGR